MRQLVRVGRASLLLAIGFWALLISFIFLQWATPSDGARLAPQLVDGGLRLSPLSGTSLNEGDILLAVDGQTVESILLALSDGDSPPAKWARGRAVTYRLLRNGESLEVVLLPGTHPLAAVLAKEWGAVVSMLALQLMMGFVFFKRPDDPITRTMFVAAAAMAAATTWSIGLTVSDLIHKTGFWIYTLSSIGAYVLIWVALCHATLLFPAPWRIIQRHRWFVPVLYVAPYLVYAAVLALTQPPNAFAGLERLGQTTSFLQGLYAVGALAGAVRSVRAGHDAVSRSQVRWVITGLIIACLAALVFGMLPEAILGEPLLNWNVIALIGLISPITFGVAVLRYRLFDIDVILNRTLVYGGLTLAIAAAYVALAGLLGAFLSTGSNSLIASLFATGLVAILFEPMRQRLQRTVNRLMYGERDEPYAVLSGLGRQLDAALTPEAILPTLVETIARTLKLPYVAISLRRADGAGWAIATAYGLPCEPTLHLPLSYQTESIGELIVAPRAADESFTPAERRLLSDIAHQAGAAAHVVRITTDLKQSRGKLITLREEERRRLRRDLHDGLGPKLAGQLLKLEAARDALLTRPDYSRAMLDELVTESGALIHEIRRLVYGLRPPVLDELGLAAAVRQQAASSELNGLLVEVRAPDALPLLPAAVEVAAFRIVQEALNNVVRHAQASHCRVQLAVVGQALEVEVSDDGLGLAPDRRVGVGLMSMRERAQEIGGSCLVTGGAAGGVRVTARLPLPEGTHT